MKKLIAIFTALVVFTSFAVAVLQTPSSILYFLNWGEYIDHALVEKFEKEYNCQVIEEDVTSSESMYQKITSDTTAYDVAIPGDYIVYQLYQEGYLEELDVNNTKYPYLSQYRTMFQDDLSSLMAEYMVDSKTGEEFNTYFCPYFWGAYSILYSTQKEDVPEVVNKNGFESLFERSLYQEDVRLGMYDTARWILSSYLMAKGYDPNITDYDGSKDGDLSAEIKNDVISALREVKFDEFGNDQLKRNVALGDLDLCFTQLGDFFDTLYLVYSESKEKITPSFSVSVPTTTAAFFDSMVIPSTCQNKDLANAFIDFMMNPVNAYQNATAIGYCPTLKSVVSRYQEEASKGAYYYGDENSLNSLTLKDFLNNYPMYLNPLYHSENVYMLESKSQAYLTTCESIFNALA